MTTALTDRFATLMTEVRGLQAEYHDAGAPMPAEQYGRYTGLIDEAEGIRATLDAGKRAAALSEWGEAVAAPDLVGKALTGAPGGAEQAAAGVKVAEPDDPVRKGFLDYLRGGMEQLRSAPDGGAAALKAMQVDADAAGGYLVMPREIMAALIAEVDDMLYIRQLATVYQVPVGASLGAPTRQTDLADADWTGEIDQVQETEGTIGTRHMRPRRLSKMFRLSNDLLRAPGISAEALWSARAAYHLALPQERAFLLGTGVDQPLGLFTPSDDGIPTGRDVDTDNTTTELTAKGLNNALYALKMPYRSRATWLFSREAIRQIRNLQDTQGRFYWQPSIVAGQPDAILGRPVVESEFVPATFTTGQYVGMVGDFRNYWIAEAPQIGVQRLVELYALTNQVAYIVRAAVDGAPVLGEAFARIKLA